MKAHHADVRQQPLVRQRLPGVRVPQPQHIRPDTLVGQRGVRPQSLPHVCASHSTQKLSK